MLVRFTRYPFLEAPDVSNEYPENYIAFGESYGLAAGATETIYLNFGPSLPDSVGGYDNETYTLYVMADGYDNLVEESDEENNTASTTIVNSSPLANSSWDVYRSEPGTDFVNVMNVTADNWTPGDSIAVMDLNLMGGTQYCYRVSQMDDGAEGSFSNVACANTDYRAEISVNPESVDFGLVGEYDVLQTDFTISNSGSGYLDWNAYLQDTLSRVSADRNRIGFHAREGSINTNVPAIDLAALNRSNSESKTNTSNSREWINL